MCLPTRRRCSGLLLSLLACVAVATTAGCGDDAGEPSPADQGDTAAKAPYGPPSRDSVSRYQRTRSDSTTLDIVSEDVGDKTIGGTGYWQRRIGDFLSSTPSGTEGWLTMPDPNTAVIAGGEFWSRTVLPNPNPSESSATVEADSPVTVDLAPPVGEPQTITTSGTVTLLGQPVTVQGTATYTLDDDNATVDTLAGPLHGCRHFSGSGSAANPELETLLGATEASGEVWYHPNLGLLRAEFQVPGKDDYTFDFLGTSEMGKATSGTNRIQAMSVLHTLETLDLDTYDVRGQFDADKDTHAKFLLEVRFAEDDKAMTSNRPPIETEIGTTMGIYPHELIASPLSFFYPEENGKGYTFWIAYVDQAARNQDVNGISYHIRATVPDYGSSPVRATARIVYHLYTP